MLIIADSHKNQLCQQKPYLFLIPDIMAFQFGKQLLHEMMYTLHILSIPEAHTGEGLHDGSLLTDLILSVNLKIDTILLHGIR